MRYRICESRSKEQLQLDVNHLIAAGWEPLGGIVVTESNAGNWWFYQAMLHRTLGPELDDNLERDSYSSSDRDY